MVKWGEGRVRNGNGCVGAGRFIGKVALYSILFSASVRINFFDSLNLKYKIEKLSKREERQKSGWKKCTLHQHSANLSKKVQYSGGQ